jgi:stage II sporulation protein D
MAAEGHPYREILAEYYPGTVLSTSAAGLKWEKLVDGNLMLETTRPEIDRSLLNDARAALRAAEEKVGWALQQTIAIRAFPTVASYRDTTGEPGWVAASTRGSVIRLQPAEALRKLTSPQSVLEHEFLHLLVESSNTARTPLWFREGLVLALSQNAPGGVSTMSEKQLEALLRSPQSEAELRRGYREAQSRVAQLIRDHGKTEVLSWLSKGIPVSVSNGR